MSGCATTLTGGIAVATTPTSTAMPPGTTSFGNVFGNLTPRICQGSYTFQFSVLDQGPYARCTVGVFYRYDSATEWWKNAIQFILPPATASECNLVIGPDDDTSKWTLGAWQETGYYWQSLNYGLQPQTNSSIPVCVNTLPSATNDPSLTPTMTTTTTTNGQPDTQALLQNSGVVVPWTKQEISITKPVLVGGVIGIALGGAALALLGTTLYWFLKRKRNEGERKVGPNIEAPSSPVSHAPKMQRGGETPHGGDTEEAPAVTGMHPVRDVGVCPTPAVAHPYSEKQAQGETEMGSGREDAGDAAHSASGRQDPEIDPELEEASAETAGLGQRTSFVPQPSAAELERT
ncbi:uncharacterized protein EV422DRAFT_196687 [Fimicolochytrium jonesii]|uniref:uncharacterized protein n=1 Tax=Fimicolochytrium jonesii TaxID=1396493 RepID=UPI0022FF19C0|nr:uncharacterized protein EV422DRAFT_196687 [Fimicolochytrium jonesii]KAI8818271.1 hypothetical protein EV422DRAFT_196687 [Fimicolochytrium jonesii]